MQGAAEYILPSCTSYIGSDGRALSMTSELRASIQHSMEEFSRKACRVLVVAVGCPSIFDKFSFGLSATETPLSFVSVYVLRDEIRPEAISAVSECHSAGIQVVMLTGDISIKPLSSIKLITFSFATPPIIQVCLIAFQVLQFALGFPRRQDIQPRRPKGQ